MPEVIATIILAIAIPAILSCAFWVLWENDLKEINQSAENEANKH